MSRKDAQTARLRGLKAFLSDRSGTTAIITGIVILVLAATGFAVFDYTRIAAAQTELQDALDSAALAAARVKGDNKASVKAGEDHLAAHVGAGGQFQNLDVDFDPQEKKVVATATAKVVPYFISMFMGGPVAIAAESEVTRQIDGSLEIALVLDTTHSMSFFGKLPALKVAAKALVQNVNKVKDADVRIAVVPFANYVNVGVSRRNEPWASVPSDWVEEKPAVEKSCKIYTTKTTCSGTEKYDCYSDGVLLKLGCTRSIGCKTSDVDPYEVCSPAKPASKEPHKFYGCVGSPAHPKNVTDNDPSRKYPGFLDVECANELTPLTKNHGMVISAIETLTTKKNTYIPAGLAWGWNVLSKPTPFTEGAAYDANNKRPRKAIVLMTDGANTMKMVAGGRHADAGASSPEADTYTKELCANIKAERIELYTVAFQIDVPAAHDMLKACATSTTHYYKADNAEELLKAFEEIGKSLENLRISH